MEWPSTSNRRGCFGEVDGAASGSELLTGANLSAMDADYAHIIAGTLLERMGIEVLELAPQHAVGRMPVAGNTQPAGLLHGGASVVLAESLGSLAAHLHAGAGRTAVGIEVSATHHRAARSGYVTGTATALHLGRSLASYEIKVEDESGRLVATARLTCMLVDQS